MAGQQNVLGRIDIAGGPQRHGVSAERHKSLYQHGGLDRMLQGIRRQRAPRQRLPARPNSSRVR